jgi:hypothetical protein
VAVGSKPTTVSSPEADCIVNVPDGKATTMATGRISSSSMMGPEAVGVLGAVDIKTPLITVGVLGAVDIRV